MTHVDHRALAGRLAEIIGGHEWHRLSECIHDDAIWEYPQSGERFIGIEKIRGQFENYPGMERHSTELHDVIGATTYALTPMYTIIAVQGSGDHGTSINRVRYPDGSRWFAVNVYRLRDDRVAHSRTYFAPDFDPPDWRAPWREPIPLDERQEL